MSADLSRVFETGEQVRRWAAERENASARLELAEMRHASATLLSRGDPVSHLGMNREHLRVLLAFLAHNDLPRLLREVANVAPEPVAAPTDHAADLDALRAEIASHAATATTYAEEINSLRARAHAYGDALQSIRRLVVTRSLTYAGTDALITEALNHADK